MTFNRPKIINGYVVSIARLITQAGMLFFTCVLFFNQAQAAVTLDDIGFSSMPGDRVQLKLQFSEPLQEEPFNFTVDNPARIAIDLPGVKLNLDKKSRAVGIGMVHSITAVEASGRTRVVVNLVRSVTYDLKTQDSLVFVNLGSGITGSNVAPMERGQPSSMGGDIARIEDIDFRRGPSGEGRVIITLSDPSIGVNLGQEAGHIVVDFFAAQLPSELDRRLDVGDFATPVKEIDTSTYSGGVRMVLSMATEQYDHLAYQSDNVYTIEVQPVTKEEKEKVKKAKFGYTGERLSLNFQNIEVRAVLQLVADFTGFNLVASDTVTGSVTLRLKNVPWDQALDIILKSRGLGMRKSGNVMLVAPQEEIAAREKIELEAAKQIVELAPLRTEFVQINYAKAEVLAGLIQNAQNNLLSERGNVSIDERTNTLIVQDVPESLEALRNLITILDIPIRQVMIESRIVNAEENFVKDIGVRFGGSKKANTIASGNPHARGGGTLGGGFGDTTAAFDNVGIDVGGADGLLVNLPVAAATSGLGLVVGKVGSYLLQLELSALLAEGRGEDIASPKIITSNQNEALIEQGVEIPYQEASSSGAATVTFKKAVLALKVTPQITPDDRVILDLQVDQDTRGSPDVLGIPPINTRSIITQVLVDDGETVVLGGIYNQIERLSSDRTPFFGEIPGLGILFRKNRVEKTRRELLIFVTPKILKQELSI